MIGSLGISKTIWIYDEFNDYFNLCHPHGKMEYWNNGIMVKNNKIPCPDQGFRDKSLIKSWTSFEDSSMDVLIHLSG